MMMLSLLAGLAVDEVAVEEVEAMATRLLFPVAGWMTMTMTIASRGARITATEAALATQTTIAITIVIEREEGEERRTEIVIAVAVATGIARVAVIATEIEIASASVSENVNGTETETEAIAEWSVIVTMIVIVAAATGSLLQRAEQAQPIEDAVRRVTRMISLTDVVEVKIMSRHQQKPKSSPSNAAGTILSPQFMLFLSSMIEISIANCCLSWDTRVAVEVIVMMRTTMWIAEREALQRMYEIARALSVVWMPVAHNRLAMCFRSGECS